jgi:hypothetical protein
VVKRAFQELSIGMFKRFLARKSRKLRSVKENFLVTPVYREFTAERSLLSDWTQKTSDRAFQELSIAVPVNQTGGRVMPRKSAVHATAVVIFSRGKFQFDRGRTFSPIARISKELR